MPSKNPGKILFDVCTSAGSFACTFVCKFDRTFVCLCMFVCTLAMRKRFIHEGVSAVASHFNTDETISSVWQGAEMTVHGSV
jgi:hypothetical protein